MKLSFLPLLQIQRDLYAMPRGMERFREYIKTMTDPETGDLALPLVAMNPMGKDHVPALIDEYIALGAEKIAAAMRSRKPLRVRRRPKPSPSKRRNTNSDSWSRTISRAVGPIAGPANSVIASRAARSSGADSSRRFSGPASLPPHRSVRDAALTSIYRAEYLQTHPAPKTLRGMLEQEGYAMARAGCATPALDADDLAYTRTVIEPHLDAARSRDRDCLSVRRCRGERARVSAAGTQRPRRAGARVARRAGFFAVVFPTGLVFAS